MLLKLEPHPEETKVVRDIRSLNTGSQDPLKEFNKENHKKKGYKKEREQL